MRLYEIINESFYVTFQHFISLFIFGFHRTNSHKANVLFECSLMFASRCLQPFTHSFSSTFSILVSTN